MRVEHHILVESERLKKIVVGKAGAAIGAVGKCVGGGAAGRGREHVCGPRLARAGRVGSPVGGSCPMGSIVLAGAGPGSFLRGSSPEGKLLWLPVLGSLLCAAALAPWLCSPSKSAAARHQLRFSSIAAVPIYSAILTARPRAAPARARCAGARAWSWKSCGSGGCTSSWRSRCCASRGAGSSPARPRPALEGKGKSPAGLDAWCQPAPRMQQQAV